MGNPSLRLSEVLLLLDYSNQSEWGMSVSLSMVLIWAYNTVNHLELFNDECTIMKEAQDANLLSQESKLNRVNLQMN